MDPLDRVNARLRRVDWSTFGERTGSRVALMREYLRRSALWSEALGCPERWPAAAGPCSSPAGIR